MFFKKNKIGKIYAPCAGRIVDLKNVEDPVFSEKILGDGVCIIPCESEIFSPVSGKIIKVFDTKHAILIKSSDGLEILMHIGINTVELKGEGFNVCVLENDEIEIGDKILDVNIEHIADMGYLLNTPIIISNMDMIKEIKTQEKDVKKGDIILEYIKR